MVMDRGNLYPLIDYEKVNRGAPYNPNIMDQTELARSMLNQNIPIETIIQETGLPREMIQQILISGQNIERTPTPTAPPSAMSGQGMLDTYTGNVGITGVPMDPQTSSIMGGDIMGYLADDIGIDPINPGDLLENLNMRQKTGQLDGVRMLESVAESGNSDEAANILKTKGELLDSDLTDEELEEIYTAADSLFQHFKYGEDLPEPDEGLPWLHAAYNMIKAGTEGEDWGTALSTTALAYLTAKKSGELEYKKELRKEDIAKYGDYNNLVSQFGLLHFKDKAALNKALREENLKARKMYDISDNGDFTDKLTIPLSDSAFNYYAGLSEFQGKIRPAKNAEVKAMSIYAPDGGILHTFMDQDAIKAWDPTRKGGATLREGHIDPTNLKLYNIVNKEGEKQSAKWLTPTQYQKMVEDGNKLTFAPTSTAAKWVIKKDTDEGTWVTDQDLLDNPDAYLDDSGFSFSIGPDGSVDISQGSAGQKRQRERQGTAAYEELLGKAQSTQAAVFGYFASAAEQDKLLKDFLEANPNAQDLPFDNLAGKAANLVEGLRISVSALSSAFQLPYEQGGMKFYIGKEISNYTAMKNTVMASDEWKEYINPEENKLAKFLMDTGVIGDALETTLFDLALQGAATYSPNKAGLDLRAISDKDMIAFMNLQGASARTLASFVDITNRFRRNLISRNRNRLKRMKSASNLLRIIDENKKPDKEKQQALIEEVDNALAELDEYEKKYQSSYTFGLTADVTTVPNYYVADASIDAGNANVIKYNPRITSDSTTGQQFRLTKDYTLQTVPVNAGMVGRNFREILNKYRHLEQSNQAQFTIYKSQLVKYLTAEEWDVFSIFNHKAPQIK